MAILSKDDCVLQIVNTKHEQQLRRGRKPLAKLLQHHHQLTMRASTNKIAAPVHFSHAIL